MATRWNSTLPREYTGDGLYTATIAAGAMSSLAGAPLAAFSATYDADATNPTVTSSSIANGDTLAPGPLTFVVTFSEELAQLGLGAEDVTLLNTLSGQSFTPTSFTYTPGTSTAQVVYGALTEGNYTLTVLTSATAFRDRRGNLLQGGNFVRNFAVDIGTQPISPIDALPPRGSLVFQGTESGIMNAVGDVDVFEVNLDATQTGQFRVLPTSATVRLRAEALDPSGAVVSSMEAPSAGDPLWLPPIAISNAVRIACASPAWQAPGATRSNCISIHCSSCRAITPWPLRSISIAAVCHFPKVPVVWLCLAKRRPEPMTFYSFSLSAGQYATVGLASLSGGQVTQLALFNEAGEQLALGQVASAGQNMNWKIQDFLATSAR